MRFEGTRLNEILKGLNKVRKNEIGKWQSLMMDYINLSHEIAIAIDATRNEFFKNKNNIEVLNFIGQRLRLKERYNDAIQLFYKSLELNPKSELALLECGLSNMRLKKYDEAIRLLSMYDQIYPNKYQALNYLINSYFLSGKKEEAFDLLFEKSIQIEDNFFDLWFLLKKELGELEEPKTEEEFFPMITLFQIGQIQFRLKKDVENEDLWLELADLYYSIRYYDESEEALSKCLGINLNNGVAYFYLALIETNRNKLHNPKKLIFFTGKSIDLGVESPALWQIRGSAFNLMKNYYEAKFCFRNAAAQARDDDKLQRLYKGIESVIEALNDKSIRIEVNDKKIEIIVD